MGADSAIAAGRAAAERLMITPCTVRRPTGVDTDDTGSDVITYAATTVYEGGCKIQDRRLTSFELSPASTTRAIQRLEVHFPVSAGPFAPGDVIFIDGIPAYRVTAEHSKSWQTAQRLLVEVVA